MLFSVKPRRCSNDFTNIIGTPSGLDGEKHDNPELKKEQPLTKTPDFDALAATTHEVTPGATMSGEAAPDAARGAGRPRLTDSQREAAREARRDKDKARRKKPASKKDADIPDLDNAVALANAAMVVTVLDVFCIAVSGGEHTATPEQRAATVEVWAAYLREHEHTLPPWVQVSIVSAIYVAPAFTTEKGRGRVAAAWDKLKTWWKWG